MNDAAAVGVLQSIGELADEVEPLVQRELVSLLRQVVIQTDLIRLAAEDDGGSKFVFLEFEPFHDARMIEAVENQVLA